MLTFFLTARCEEEMCARERGEAGMRATIRGPEEREQRSFAQRLADDCRRLASKEHEESAAALFKKLACLFDEAAALQRWQVGRLSSGGDEFDTWY
jgi:hypothetical protein